jgi:hypothetical protein
MAKCHFRPEAVKKSFFSRIFEVSGLMQNVCRCPSDRLQGILVRLFLTPKSRHICNSIFSHLPVAETFYVAKKRRSQSTGIRHAEPPGDERPGLFTRPID